MDWFSFHCQWDLMAQSNESFAEITLIEMVFTRNAPQISHMWVKRDLGFLLEVPILKYDQHPFCLFNSTG